MHQAITKVHLGQTVAPADNTGKIQSTDYSNDFKEINEKMNKL